jgi:5'-3' exonuclease
MIETALIDGDVVLFQACCIVGGRTPYWVDIEDDTTHYFSCHEDEHEFVTSLDEAGIVYRSVDMTQKMVDKGIVLMEKMIERILRDTGATAYEFIVSSLVSTVNYRYAIDPQYKQHRPPKPSVLPFLRHRAQEKIGLIETKCGEADDELGRKSTVSTCICSIDKDLLMVPGMHYNLSTRKMIKVKELGSLELSKDRKTLKGTGYLWFCAQVLTGDRVDNIPGLPRYGPVKAYNALSKCTSREGAWRRVRRLYALSGQSEAYLKQQKQLIYIQGTPICQELEKLH